MKYLYLIIAAVVMLSLVSCDRFDHEQTPINFNAELFLPLQNALNAASQDSLDAVMAFYDDEYLHDAVNKAQRRDFYNSLFVLYGEDITFSTVFSSYNANDQSVSWELQVFAPGVKTPVRTVAFTNEKLVRNGDQWTFYGDRIIDLVQGDRQRVIIESFTYTTCPNCPLVEEVMHSLQAQYPAQFSYMEYHMGDALDIGNSDIFSYYGYSAMPASVFQGMEKRIGANPETLEAYIAFVNNMVTATPTMHLNDLDYSFSGHTLYGSVTLEPTSGTIDPTNLRLRYALIEKVSALTNSAGVPCTNVVLAKGSLDISGNDLNQPVTFSLPFTGTLPSDTSLVIFVQKMPTPFTNNAPIYNGLEIPVTVPAR